MSAMVPAARLQYELQVGINQRFPGGQRLRQVRRT